MRKARADSVRCGKKALQTQAVRKIKTARQTMPNVTIEKRILVPFLSTPISSDLVCSSMRYLSAFDTINIQKGGPFVNNFLRCCQIFRKRRSSADRFSVGGLSAWRVGLPPCVCLCRFGDRQADAAVRLRPHQLVSSAPIDKISEYAHHLVGDDVLDAAGVFFGKFEVCSELHKRLSKRLMPLVYVLCLFSAYIGKA